MAVIHVLDKHTAEIPWKSFCVGMTGRMRMESVSTASMRSTPHMPVALMISP